MSIRLTVEGGKQVLLPTAGKYCSRNILIDATGPSQADLQASYDAGVLAGEEAGAAHCAAQHFVHNFTGSGGGSVSFRLPFEPDALVIIGFDPTCRTVSGALNYFVCDLRAFGLLGGYSSYINNAGEGQTTIYTTKTVLTRYSRTADGLVTIGNITAAANVIFAPGFAYTVIAVRYAEQTDAERIAAFIGGLTGSGTVTLNRDKVTAAFTDDEWVMLIATQPNWTFTWI